MARNSAVGARSSGMVLFYNTYWDKGQRPAIIVRYIQLYQAGQCNQ
jgi:hypothetical protein